MTSPAGYISSETAGEKQDGGLMTEAVVLLSVPVEWMRFCPVCQHEERFVARFEVTDGLLGDCANCGATFVVPFTRSVTEEE